MSSRTLIVCQVVCLVSVAGCSKKSTEPTTAQTYAEIVRDSIQRRYDALSDKHSMDAMKARMAITLLSSDDANDTVVLLWPAVKSENHELFMRMTVVDKYSRVAHVCYRWAEDMEPNAVRLFEGDQYRSTVTDSPYSDILWLIHRLQTLPDGEHTCKLERRIGDYGEVRLTLEVPRDVLRYMQTSWGEIILLDCDGRILDRANLKGNTGLERGLAKMSSEIPKPRVPPVYFQDPNGRLIRLSGDSR